MSTPVTPFVRKWAAKTPGPTREQRTQVLRLYREILQIGKRTWTGPPHYKKYIVEEARRLFKLNKDLKYVEDIDKRLEEARARIDLALHYKNPKPRLYHAWGKTPENVRTSTRAEIVNSVYLTSYTTDKKDDE